MEQHDNEINLNYRVWIWQIGASVLLHEALPVMQQHDMILTSTTGYGSGR